MNRLLPVAVVVQKILVGAVFRIDVAEFKKVPAEGPIIVIANHINTLEVPLMLSHLHPRLVTGMAKSDAWKNPIYRVLYNIYRAVPVRRGEVDLNAIKLCMERLSEKYVLAVAPEGTRSRDGKMRQARAGVAILAVKSGAPVMPMSHIGSENMGKNLRSLKRTPFILKVGNQFTVDLHGERMNKEVSQQVTDEMMWQIAAMLPPFYRGYYSNLDQATEKYLHFEPGVESNLKRAAETDLMTPPDA
jgi:1-acyl-sn-glycerol-3-phosphate acyltransferase